MLDTLYPDEWDYVGDFTFKIEHKNPDFKHKTKNLLIEHFGIYPHGDLAGDNYGKTEQGRIEFLEKCGYKTLVIWDVELYNQLPIVIGRIIKFVEGN
jgi:very-short-patch-repair endonuclease